MENNANQNQWEVAEVKLTYNTKVKASKRPKIDRSQASADIFRKSWDTNIIDMSE